MNAGRIALGTVQFGLDYGISNDKGKVSVEEAGKLLEIAQARGVQMLDTAAAYGESEEVLGQLIGRNELAFEVVSKLAPGAGIEDVQSHLKLANQRFGVPLYGYLFHQFETYRANKEIWKELLLAKAEGRVHKVGFSLYHPEELEELWESGVQPDLIQVPFNIFDQRFEVLFEKAKQNLIEIHTRSAFLQGLFFMNPDHLHPFFQPVGSRLKKIIDLAKQENMDIAQLCIAFVMRFKAIGKVVLGVTTEKELQTNLDQKEISDSTFAELLEMRESDSKYFLPYLWPKN